MKHTIKNGIIFWLTASIVFILCWVVYAAWNDIVSTGDPVTATKWNELVNKVSDIESSVVTLSGSLEGVGFRLWGNAQSVPNSTTEIVTNFSTGVSLNDLGNSSYSNGIITIGSDDAGWWQLNGRLADALGWSGLFVYIYKNGTSISSSTDRTATSVSGSHYVSTSEAIKLEPGDQISLRVLQNSGGVTSTDEFSLSGVRIGP